MPADQLQTLKIYELEPLHKHPAIFECFDKLQPGESFIIENDHDPIPLYYELKTERTNELGKFEFLQQGPGLWRVQITKSRGPEQPYNSCSIQKETSDKPEKKEEPYHSCSTGNEEPGVIDQSAQPYNACSVIQETPGSTKGQTLEVTKLEPKLKHPIVFEWFNGLKPGESFTLKNDHDPKPLYYQMLGELGPVFNWQYAEQGPECWKVVIQKKITGEPTIGAIAAKDIRKADAMKKMGIDFCCGGNKTVRQAAIEAGITKDELDKVLTESEHVIVAVTNAYDKWEADFLADYIFNQHHKYFYESREAILQLVLKVREVHGKNHPELIRLGELIDKLFNDLKTHFYKEEKVLFPYIKELVIYKKDGTRPSNPITIAKGPLAMMHMEHETAGDILKTMSSVTNDYRVPDDACNSFRWLYVKLKELENDLHQHIHLENNILFPKALQLEKELVD